MAEERPKITLYNRAMGEENFETNVLRLPTTDGGTRDFVEGTPVEKTVELDFSGGDMTVIPGEGELFSKVLIPVPAGLAPENIPDGVTIAGIVGTLIASAPKEIKYASGSIPSRSADYTVEHGLGVTPDIVIVYTAGNQAASTKNVVRIFIGLSSAMAAAIGNTMYCYYGSTAYGTTVSSKYYYGYGADLVTPGLMGAASALIDTTSNGWYSVVREADDSKFVLTYSTLTLALTTLSSLQYNWIAIGGLT